jgi:hypothetical protein
MGVCVESRIERISADSARSSLSADVEGLRAVAVLLVSTAFARSLSSVLVDQVGSLDMREDTGASLPFGGRP